MWNREDLAWAAGFFEGEGSISLRQYHSSAIAAVSNTDYECLVKFVQIVRVGKVYGPYKGTNKPTYKKWLAQSYEETQACMAMLWPWLSTRRKEKAAEVLTSARLAWFARPRSGANLRSENRWGIPAWGVNARRTS